MITALDVLEALTETMSSKTTVHRAARSLARDPVFLQRVAAKLRKKVKAQIEEKSLTENELTGDLVGFCSTTTRAREAAVRLRTVFHVLHRLPDKKEGPRVKLPPELIERPKKKTKKGRRVVR